MPRALGSQTRMPRQIHQGLHKVQNVLQRVQEPWVFMLVPMHVEGSGEAATCFLNVEPPASLGPEAFGHAGRASKCCKAPGSGPDSSQLQLPSILQGVGHFKDDGSALLDLLLSGSLERDSPPGPSSEIAAQVSA